MEKLIICIKRINRITKLRFLRNYLPINFPLNISSILRDENLKKRDKGIIYCKFQKKRWRVCINASTVWKVCRRRCRRREQGLLWARRKPSIWKKSGFSSSTVNMQGRVVHISRIIFLQPTPALSMPNSRKPSRYFVKLNTMLEPPTRRHFSLLPSTWISTLYIYIEINRVVKRSYHFVNVSFVEFFFIEDEKLFIGTRIFILRFEIF